jgi:membrane-bound inhibitor of C-type lysozyme
MASGRAVTLKGYEFGENVPTELWDWFGGNHQKFTVNYRGAGFYNIVFVHSGKALEAENNSTASGARVVQYTLHAHGYSAQWSFRNP